MVPLEWGQNMPPPDGNEFSLKETLINFIADYRRDRSFDAGETQEFRKNVMEFFQNHLKDDARSFAELHASQQNVKDDLSKSQKETSDKLQRIEGGLWVAGGIPAVLAAIAACFAAMHH